MAQLIQPELNDHNHLSSRRFVYLSRQARNLSYLSHLTRSVVNQ